MNIEWFPGHIAKARREIKSQLKNVDLVIEIIDARCPLSSINFLNEEIKNKKYLLIINKIDLADKKKVQNFIEDYSKKYRELNADDMGLQYVAIDSRKNDIKKIIDKKIDILCDELKKRYEIRGINNFKVKAMVVGAPNVGKSTFINSYVKRKINNVENRAGVTKSLSWTKISDKVLLLDTPGVTIPKFSSDKAGLNLAIIGSLNDNNFDKVYLASELINIIKNDYFDVLKKKYIKKENVEFTKESSTEVIIEEIAKNNGYLKKGGIVDTERTANVILSDFRNGRIGGISLE